MLPRVALLSLGAALCAAQSFSTDVQPIFEKRCLGCHGPTQQMSGLRLDSAEAAQRAGTKLIARVTSDLKGFFMPPVGPRLSESEIAKIQQWLAASAVSATAARLTHWSFQPVARVTPPAVKKLAWVRTPIDRFVLARLDQEKIAPSPAADRNTLLRRLSLDLTGLPPTPGEVAAFVADKNADAAYERAVDRLLTSPHYGEKWARSWLDLAHYADSDGYEKDNSRPWAWRYRQWVIESLNRDQGFDQFTIEQLAGDLLDKPTVNQRVATGFLRNTLTNREGGVDRAEARFEQIVNRTNTVATTWLGLTVGCAQCHNHKFDPISQKEYYKMFAFFDRTEEEDIDAPLPGEKPPPPEYQAKREQILEQYWIRELMVPWERRLRQAHNDPGRDLEWDFALTDFRSTIDHALHMLSDDPAQRTRREWDRMIAWFLGHVGPDYAKDRRTVGQIREARDKLDALGATLSPYTQAPAMRDDPTKPPTNLRLGGDYRTMGEAVSPGTLAVLPTLPAANATRLDLARWLVSRENPLTARVAVNRMWQEFFGRGLVRTSEDFGTQGEKPTHPELLDWLATEFVERGWSMKQLAKTIVMSAAYRQSSKVRPEVAVTDPENALLARQSRLRLPAELIRDQVLAVSGLLNPEIGGRSIKPPQPKGVAELSYANNVKWRESTGADRYRRGMYIHYQRTAPYPQLMNFDEPDSNVSCARRRRSNTPLQALNLLNDPVFFEGAEALAKRIEKEGGDNPLGYAFALTLAREPSPAERARIQQFRSDGGTWLGVARILLNLDELITRE